MPEIVFIIAATIIAFFVIVMLPLNLSNRMVLKLLGTTALLTILTYLLSTLYPFWIAGIALIVGLVVFSYLFGSQFAYDDERKALNEAETEAQEPPPYVPAAAAAAQETSSEKRPAEEPPKPDDTFILAETNEASVNEKNSEDHGEPLPAAGEPNLEVETPDTSSQPSEEDAMDMEEMIAGTGRRFVVAEEEPEPLIDADEEEGLPPRLSALEAEPQVEEETGPEPVKDELTAEARSVRAKDIEVPAAAETEPKSRQDVMRELEDDLFHDSRDSKGEK
ncbi:hypothetical protein B0H94_10940 [Salsuginibacillus halophilus]|uniref:Uncharacterized protein n=1 Tax=Salsuginibacillus halophilus TaxID=517424 RepID=A0A2P8HCL8_9BACI|nr:hypothetical protein [Salsuginibacillus halophilus]PSL43984.1 hypothetical protein B0H94_10940 [Salsuginibacillus halophilus]